MESKIECCQDCRFFLPMGPNGGINPEDLKAPTQGFCRRFPPTVQIIGMAQNPMNPKAPAQPQATRTMPTVAGPEWCGEFERKLSIHREFTVVEDSKV